MSKPVDLDRVRVTGECPRSFESLTPQDGRDRFRHCGDCDRRVYNLEALTAREARKVLSGPERVCAQVVRRPDGSLVTRPGPLQRVARALTRAASLLLLGGSGLLGACTREVPKALAPERVLEPPVNATEEHPELDAEMLGQLRALGYVDID